jgi:hypothetical protein
MPSQEPGTRGHPTGLDCTVAGASAGAIHLTVSPARAVVRRRTRFTFRATTVVAGRLVPVAGATITFAGRRLRTDSHGRARVTVALRAVHAYAAVARKAGLRLGRTTVRTRTARRRRTTARHGPRFTG